MGALVVLAAQAGVVDPGSTGECVVLVRNTDGEHDDFDVLVHGPAAVWATVEPSVVSLAPDEEAPVWVRFAVPRSAAVPPGAVEFAVTVASHRDPSFIHAERGELHVGSSSRLAAALDPIDEEGRTMTVRIHLTNEGNAPADATVRVAGELDQDQRVTVGPNAREVVEFCVRRTRDLRRVVVEVVADTGESFSLAAAVPDESRSLRRDLSRSAAVLGALLFSAFVAVALVGGDEDGSAPGTVFTAAPSTTAAPPAGAGAGEGDEASTPQAPAGDDTLPAIAANTGAARPATSELRPTPDDLPMLAFVRVYGPGDRDVVIRGPGRVGGELRLRTPGAVESAPALSPDGSRVAFVQERGGLWKACLALTTGGGEVCLFDVAATSSLAWRPDGSALFAARGNDLIEVTLDATLTYAQSTTTHPVAVPGGRFGLSPDGTRIVVAAQGEIAMRPIDGGDGLTISVPGTPDDPTWSPDGGRIVYTADGHVHVAPVGDGPIRQLTAPQTVNGDPVVAGGWVVFRSNRSGNGDLYAVAIDGADREAGGIAQVTRTAERDIDPAR